MIEKKDEVIIVNAYINTPAKEMALNRCIDQLLKLDRDIMIVSHTPIKKNIIEKVHYYIYDYNNEFLPEHLSDYLWFSDPNVYYQTNKHGFARHSYSVWRSIQNAVSFAKILNKKFFYHLHYDSYIDDRDLNAFNEVRKDMGEKRGYVHKYPVYIRDGNEFLFDAFYCVFFAFDVDFFLDKISPLVYSPEEYHLRNRFDEIGVEVATIQCYLYNMFKKFLDEIYIIESDKEEVKIFPNSKFNTIYIDSGRHVIDIVKDRNSDGVYFVMYNDSESTKNYKIIFSRGEEIFHREERSFNPKVYYYLLLNGEPFDIRVYFEANGKWDLVFEGRSDNLNVAEHNYIEIGRRTQ